jgi:hypothetical protein
MINKRTTDIIIFSIAVLLLLLRPFVVYQIAETPKFSGDPVAANSLLQRLIKKKDDHHSTGIQEYLAFQLADKKKRPLLPRYITLNNVSNRNGSFTVSAILGQPTIFKVCSPDKYYCLLSKFQI